MPVCLRLVCIRAAAAQSVRRKPGLDAPYPIVLTMGRGTALNFSTSSCATRKKMEKAYASMDPSTAKKPSNAVLLHSLMEKLVSSARDRVGALLCLAWSLFLTACRFPRPPAK